MPMKSYLPQDKPCLIISKTLWRNLILDLRKRGKGKRESGAFLIGNSKNTHVTEYICYDDLDPHSLDRGYIYFTQKGFTPLWAHCKKNNVQVLADIHTHPGVWTEQSELDRTNPSIPVKGHIALIVPVYAKKNLRTLKGVGIYEYEANFNWKTFTLKDNVINLK
jgi:proteasome lid subunit RPN8/RPN11